jgi:hypothetical protein
MFKSTQHRQAASILKRIAIPKAASFGMMPGTVSGTAKRKAEIVTSGGTSKRLCAPDPAVSSVIEESLDMSLAMDHDSHKCVIKMIVKSKLFPLVKFITEGATDMQYSESEGICAFLLGHCNVTGNPRLWWQTYDRLVRRVVNDHRNNKIKCIQNAYYGKYRRLFGNACSSNMCILPISTALRQDKNVTLEIAKCVDAMRGNPDGYETMWLLFGPTVLGTSEWRDHANTCAMTELLTVSDEAFLLVVLDNYHTRWDAMVDRANAGYTMVCYMRVSCELCREHTLTPYSLNTGLLNSGTALIERATLWQHYLLPNTRAVTVAAVRLIVGRPQA